MKKLKSKRTSKSTKSSIKFLKIIIIVCISFIILYTLMQLLLCYILNVELTPTLTTCVYSFFGTELAACAVIKVFDKDSTSKNLSDYISKNKYKDEDIDTFNNTNNDCMG